MLYVDTITFLAPAALGKIILGNQQIALLCDPWRITKPTADPVQGELSLQFGLSAGTPLLKFHTVEQSWPTREAGAAKQSRHLAA
jgi:hypothetical protein